jgi:2-oxoglutarate dehydrogenase E1 component
MVRDVLELSGSLGFLDEMYEQLQAAPATVDESWHGVLGDAGFNGHNGNGHALGSTNGQVHVAGVSGVTGANGHAPATNGNGRPKTGVTRAMPQLAYSGALSHVPGASAALQSGVYPLVNAYRSRGHFAANLDPLGLLETARIIELEPSTWGFTERDLDAVVDGTGVYGLPRATVRELVD